MNDDKPWENEPSELYWVDEHTGLQCAIKRTAQLGHLCGYVAVDSSHPFYRKEYSSSELDIDVHGGLTFSGEAWCWDNKHPDLYSFGFDCAHSGDYCPGYEKYSWHERGMGEAYRDIEFVKAEVTSLAAQLHNLSLA